MGNIVDEGALWQRGAGDLPQILGGPLRNYSGPFLDQLTRNIQRHEKTLSDVLSTALSKEIRDAVKSAMVSDAAEKFADVMAFEAQGPINNAEFMSAMFEQKRAIIVDALVNGSPNDINFAMMIAEVWKIELGIDVTRPPCFSANTQVLMFDGLGSRLIDRQSQNMTVAASATAERKVLAHRS